MEYSILFIPELCRIGSTFCSYSMKNRIGRCFLHLVPQHKADREAREILELIERFYQNLVMWEPELLP